MMLSAVTLFMLASCSEEESAYYSKRGARKVSPPPGTAYYGAMENKTATDEHLARYAGEKEKEADYAAAVTEYGMSERPEPGMVGAQGYSNSFDHVLVGENGHLE